MSRQPADVSQRTFFGHVASKEAVLHGDMDGLGLRVRAALDSRPPDEPVSNLPALVAGAFDAVADIGTLAGATSPPA